MVSRDSIEAAGEAFRAGFLRSAVSRAYFAVFAGVTAFLLNRRLSPPPDRYAWSHAVLPDMMSRELAAKPRLKADVRRLLGRLYKARIEADYKAHLSFHDAEARRALSDASALPRMVMK